MSKSGSNEIKETSAQQAAADVATQQWDIYNNGLKKYEDQFMDKVDNANSDKAYSDLAGDTNLAYAKNFSKAATGTADSLASAGVDPTSGKYQSTMGSLRDAQSSGMMDTTNKVQTDQSNKYVAGLKDVVSIGQGQKAEALQGYSGLANSSAQAAANDAYLAQQKSSGIANTVGTAAGMGLSYYMGKKKPSASVTDEQFNNEASNLEQRGAFTGSQSLYRGL